MNVRIKSIKQVNCKSKRYDIQTKKNNNFFMNGVLVHNSMINVYNYKGEWYTGTRSSACATGQCGSLDISFNGYNIVIHPHATAYIINIQFGS